MEIPTGTQALTAQNTPISSIEIREETQPIVLPRQASIIGSIYDFGPDGATFNPAITVSLGYDPNIASSGVSLDDVIIIRLDNRREWTELESVVDRTNSVVTAQTNHFTQFAVAVANRSSSTWPIIAGVVGGIAALVVIAGGGIAYRNRRRGPLTLPSE